MLTDIQLREAIASGMFTFDDIFDLYRSMIVNGIDSENWLRFCDALTENILLTIRNQELRYKS